MTAHTARMALFATTLCTIVAAGADDVGALDEGGARKPGAARLILLYAPCTVNASYLSPHERSVDFTPNVARLAAAGVTFRRHSTETGQSSIAYASIVTGTQAPKHGVYSIPSALDDSNLTMAEAFAAAGFDTYFWDAQPMASREYNFEQGVPDGNIYPGKLGSRANLTKLTTILEHLRKNPKARAFVMAFFTVTHSPYDSSRAAGFCRRFSAQCAGTDPNRDAEEFSEYVDLYRENLNALTSGFPEAVQSLGLKEEQVQKLASVLEIIYKSNVHHLDVMFGRVLASIDSAGLMDESIVVFTADHGEVLYRENALFKWTHGWQLAPEVLRVPWIVFAPGARPAVIDGVTRSVDVMPTMLSLADVPVDPEDASRIDGVDVAPVILGRRPVPKLEARSHTAVLPSQYAHWIATVPLWKKFHKGVDVFEPWVAIERGDVVMKYRNLDGEQWGFQAFHAHAPLEERRDMFDPDSPFHRSLRERLLDYREELRRGWTRLESRPELTDEDLERLRSLGYVD